MGTDEFLLLNQDAQNCCSCRMHYTHISLFGSAVISSVCKMYNRQIMIVIFKLSTCAVTFLLVLSFCGIFCLICFAIMIITVQSNTVCFICTPHKGFHKNIKFSTQRFNPAFRPTLYPKEKCFGLGMWFLKLLLKNIQQI